MPIGVGSIVCSKMGWKVVKKDESGRIISGEWVEVSKGDVGKVVSVLRRKHKGPSYRVKFRDGLVGVEGHHLTHIDGSAEEPLSREVMKVADPDFSLRKDEGVEDAEY